MVDFSAGYLPPGVYVDTQSTGSIAAVGVGTPVLCLVGDGIGYETNTENVSFASANQITLVKSFIDPSSIVISATLDSGKTVFVADTTSPTAQHDYAVAQASNQTTITRHTSGQVPTNVPVTITYRYADDAYYALNKFTDYASLSQVYGAALDPVTGEIVSPITFAAEQAFRNGANIIYAVAVDPRASGSRASQFQVAYTKMLPNYEINLLVPLTTDVVDTASATTFLSDVSSFLDSASTQGFPMMAICGVMATYSTTDPDTLATGVANRRLVLIWPPSINFFNSVLNSTDVADGIYFAAACAGVLASNDLDRGLTRSQVIGFTAIPASVLATMTTTRKNTWSSKGVAVAETNRSSQLVIRAGVTTDTSDVGNREISIVRCQDALLEIMQLSVESADLIGDPITPNTPLMVASLISGALENALAQGIVFNYTDPIVTQQQAPGGDPTVIAVTFSYQPTYPLNYITVNFTLDLTTSTLTSSLNTSTTTDTTP